MIVPRASRYFHIQAAESFVDDGATVSRKHAGLSRMNGTSKNHESDQRDPTGNRIAVARSGSLVLRTYFSGTFLSH
jgi:hypothetical protein